jgi:hypothetical protein
VPFKEEEQALTRPYAFLEALFTVAVQELKAYKKGTASDIALAWYKWMSYGATHTSVGTNRTAFYDRVIEAAEVVRRRRSASVLLLIMLLARSRS